MQLPIDPHLPAIVAAVAEHTSLVLMAEPGAGKTTRVPRALLQARPTDSIWVLQPRRLAARLAARYVARELGERLGERVGYRVRYESEVGPHTRLTFMTEGMLLRGLAQDPRLRDVGVIVFDEFHGRTLASDVGLAIVRHLRQTTRPDLAVVVMSATLDAGPLQAYLPQAPVVHVPGRAYPVEVEHLPHKDARPLDAQVASQVLRLLREDLRGDVLTFLPGVGEIRRAAAACAGLAKTHDLRVVMLHGSLSPSEQDDAVRPTAERKLVLATNVAETSVTLENVVAVIDSGLARTASHNALSGVASLQLQAISQAAAVQRAGRAGRTGPGRCLRLYTRQDFQRRASHEAPEIARLDLTEMALLLRHLSVPPLDSLVCLDPPPQAAVTAAETLLERLGAVAPDGTLTSLGHQMAELPLHPRLARLLIEANARGAGRLGAAAAAYLAEGRPTLGGPPVSADSDLIVQLERVPSDSPQRRAQKQLLGQLRAPRDAATDPEDALARAVLAGFPDRVARRVPGAKGRHELLLCNGKRVQLSPQSAVQDAPFVVALQAQERIQGSERGTLVDIAQAVSPDWLLDLTPSVVTEVDEVVWNAERERVESLEQLRYETLVLTETRRTDVDLAAAAPVLAMALQARGWENFFAAEALQTLRGRLRVVKELQPGLPLPDLDGARLQETLRDLCAGCRSFVELRAAQPMERLQATFEPPAFAALARLAPTHVTLAGGRRLLVHYETDRPPWVESFLQDFFGLLQGPRIGDGRKPLTLHLLAPNRRALQVTTDLEGFWTRHYPELKKALSRRYPRHAWPEDPRTAQPPRPRH